MIKYFRSAFLSISLFIFSFSLIMAYSADFAVTKIGALNLDGHTYPEWWYTGVNPTFYGTGSAGSEVTVKIGENYYKTTTDTSGNWSYYAAIAQGDYNLTFSQGASSYSFVLHLGQALPENLGTAVQTTQSTSAVPTTGSNQIAAIGFGMGIALLASYFYINGSVDKRALFEKRIIRED